MSIESELVRGAFDLHAHVYPEFTLGMPARVGNLEWARLASEAGMRGFVLKSHVWPTVAVAHTIREAFPDLDVLGSITCNLTAGGLNPVAVEIAIQSGARIVWMPTVSARRASGAPGAFIERMRPFIGGIDRDASALGTLDVVGEDGELTVAAREIVELCGRYGVAIATGHLPVSQSLALARACRERAVAIVMTHPLNGSVAASIDDQLEFVSLGGLIEHTFITTMPMHHRVDPHEIVRNVRAVGAENCVMATDTIEAWNPPAPEVMRMYVASMLAMGVSADDVWLMTHDTPLRVVGFSDEGAPGRDADRKETR